MLSEDTDVGTARSEGTCSGGGVQLDPPGGASDEEEDCTPGRPPYATTVAVDMTDLDAITAEVSTRAQEDLSSSSGWKGWTVRSAITFVSPDGNTTLISHGEHGASYSNGPPSGGGDGRSARVAFEDEGVARCGGTTRMDSESEDAITCGVDGESMTERIAEAVSAEVQKWLVLPSISTVLLNVEEAVNSIGEGKGTANRGALPDTKQVLFSVGSIVCRKFYQQWIRGKIVEVDVDDRELPYLVRFEDGDQQDMSHGDAIEWVIPL